MVFPFLPYCLNTGNFQFLNQKDQLTWTFRIGIFRLTNQSVLRRRQKSKLFEQAPIFLTRMVVRMACAFIGTTLRTFLLIRMVLVETNFRTMVVMGYHGMDHPNRKCGK